MGYAWHTASSFEFILRRNHPYTFTARRGILLWMPPLCCSAFKWCSWGASSQSHMCAAPWCVAVAMQLRNWLDMFSSRSKSLLSSGLRKNSLYFWFRANLVHIINSTITGLWRHLRCATNWRMCSGDLWWTCTFDTNVTSSSWSVTESEWRHLRFNPLRCPALRYDHFNRISSCIPQLLVYCNAISSESWKVRRLL
jgi:hypothetical protein